MTSQMGNIMTQLQGLKNIAGRRVMPEEEYLDEVDENLDVAGTSQLPDFSQFTPNQQNQPQVDLGSQITPQSSDIRANTIQRPEDTGIYQRLGQALGEYTKSEEQERNIPEHLGPVTKYMNPPPTAQSQNVLGQIAPKLIPEKLPQQETVLGSLAPRIIPKTMPEPEIGIGQVLSDYFFPGSVKNAQQQQASRDLIENSYLKSGGNDPEVIKSFEQKKLQENIKKAEEAPWDYAAYGAANTVADHPALKAKFETITGINYEPQIAAQVSQYEQAMQSVEDALNGIDIQVDQVASDIRQRILQNQTTDNDKYFIGMALMMPLLIGGFFGKEAGVNALAGGAKGLADVYGRREEGLRQDEQSLLDIGKQKAGIQEKLANIKLKGAEIAPNLRKNLPKQENQHLIGMKSGKWTDPITGQEVEGTRIKPGFVAKPEYVSSEKGKADMLKSANELTDVKTYVDEINDLTDDIATIVSQLDNKNIFSQAFATILAGKEPSMLSHLTQDVNFDGRKVNAGTLLEEKLGFLANAYGQAKDLGQLDRAAQSHIKKIIDNPTSSFLTPKDALNKIIEVRKLAQKGLINNASNKGFYPEFLQEEIGERNEKFYAPLNKQEQDKRLLDVEKEMNRQEPLYAR